MPPALPVENTNENKPAEAQAPIQTEVESGLDAKGEPIEDKSLAEIIATSEPTVAAAISDTKKYLDEYMREIQIGVLNGGNDNYRNNLGKKLESIADEKTRGEVKELLKKEMADAFEENRKEYVSGAVAEARTFETLYKVVKQFKQVNLTEEYGEYLSPLETIAEIEKARLRLTQLLSDKSWVQMVPEAQQMELDRLLAGVPIDSGIRGKVKILLNKEIDEARSVSNSGSSADSTEDRPAGGWLKKTWGKLKFWKK